MLNVNKKVAFLGISLGNNTAASVATEDGKIYAMQQERIINEKKSKS